MALNQHRIYVKTSSYARFNLWNYHDEPLHGSLMRAWGNEHHDNLSKNLMTECNYKINVELCLTQTHRKCSYYLTQWTWKVNYCKDEWSWSILDWSSNFNWDAEMKGVSLFSTPIYVITFCVEFTLRTFCIIAATHIHYMFICAIFKKYSNPSVW